MDFGNVEVLIGRRKRFVQNFIYTPLDTLHRAVVHGLLDEQRGGAPGVNDQSKTQGLVHLKDPGADFLATAAVNAVSPEDMRGRVRHKKEGFRFEVFLPIVKI
jgi:hypothetical protein